VFTSCCHARRQKADRAQLVGLDQPALQFLSFSNVVENHQAPDPLAVLGHQRSDGQVHDGVTGSGIRAAVPVAA